MPIMEKIRTTLPLSEEIWRFSERGLDPDRKEKVYDDLAAFETRVREKLADGTYSLDRHVAPDWADPKRYFGDLSLEA